MNLEKLRSRSVMNKAAG